MKALNICAAFLAAMFATHAVLAADDNDRPAGVEAQHWLPISDRLGFVVMAEKDNRIISGSRQVLLADPERVSSELMPPKKGYFVIRTKAGWQRVVVADLSERAG
jgi:hypothetical protein